MKMFESIDSTTTRSGPDLWAEIWSCLPHPDQEDSANNAFSDSFMDSYPAGTGQREAPHFAAQPAVKPWAPLQDSEVYLASLRKLDDLFVVCLNLKLEVLRKHVEVLLHQIWFSIFNFSFCPHHMYLSDVILQGVSGWLLGRSPLFPVYPWKQSLLSLASVSSKFCFICWHFTEHSYLLLVAHVFRLPKIVKPIPSWKKKVMTPELHLDFWCYSLRNCYI